MAKFFSSLLSLVMVPGAALAADVKVGDPAPLFTVKDHEGKEFALDSRKGKWTVLYFYPKAETPGCTKQACAFRDSIQKVRDLGAEVYGVSNDEVEALAKFRTRHRLNFPLLADPQGKVIAAYGTKMPVVKMSRRWTFIIDPELKIRVIDKDVDPVKDVDHVAARIKELQES